MGIVHLGSERYWLVGWSHRRPQVARKGPWDLLGAQTPLNVYFPWSSNQACGEKPVPSPRSQPYRILIFFFFSARSGASLFIWFLMWDHKLLCQINSPFLKGCSHWNLFSKLGLSPSKKTQVDHPQTGILQLRKTKQVAAKYLSLIIHTDIKVCFFKKKT